MLQTWLDGCFNKTKIPFTCNKREQYFGRCQLVNDTFANFPQYSEPVHAKTTVSVVFNKSLTFRIEARVDRQISKLLSAVKLSLPWRQNQSFASALQNHVAFFALLFSQPLSASGEIMAVVDKPHSLKRLRVYLSTTRQACSDLACIGQIQLCTVTFHQSRNTGL